MHIVDSCGWLEWFSNGPLADAYGKYIANPEKILLPGVVLYEVYKIIKRDAGEDKALPAIGYMKNAIMVFPDETLLLKAADISLEHHLAMADAMVYAVAVTHDCPLYTSDADLRSLPLVHCLSAQNSV
jgi:predicted nucleic acid-binding protein